MSGPHTELNQMRYLLELTGALSEADQKKVERAIESHGKRGKRGEFFQLLISGAVGSDLEAARRLYGRKPDSAYSHLKNRLIRAILGSLFPEPVSVTDGSTFGVRYQCRREILIGQFFIHRRAYNVARKALMVARETALAANLVAEALIVEDLLIQHFFEFKLPDSKDQKRLDVDLHTKILRSSLEVKRHYKEMAHIARFHNVREEALKASMIRILQHTPSATEAGLFPELKYWWLRSSMLYNRVRREYALALQFARELLALVQDEQVVLPLALKLDARVDAARLYLYQQENAKCERLVHTVLREAHPDSIAYLDAVELSFLMNFYEEAFESAAHKLAIALRHPKLKEFAFARQKWMYYQLNLEFMKGNYRLSLQLLSEVTEFPKYKSKWLLGYKVLELYNLTCLGDFDLVEYKLHALKQLLKRQRQYDVHRCKFICKVLSTFVRTSYNHEKTYKTYKDDLFIAWEPLNYEVVNIEMWLRRLYNMHGDEAGLSI